MTYLSCASIWHIAGIIIIFFKFGKSKQQRGQTTFFSSQLSIFSLKWGKAWYQVQCLSVLHEQNRGEKSYYKTQHSQDCWKCIIKKKKIKKHLQWRFMPTNLHTIIVRNFCSCFSKRACPVLPACAGRTTTPGGFPNHTQSHMAITGTEGWQTRW